MLLMSTWLYFEYKGEKVNIAGGVEGGSVIQNDMDKMHFMLKWDVYTMLLMVMWP
jgi:hypothetical protein